MRTIPLKRRSFVGGLLALAAPAIIRVPGLLMPVRAAKRVLEPIDDPAMGLAERYSIGWADWRGMWGNDPGDMDGFAFAPDDRASVTDRNVDLAQARMRRLRDLEQQIADAFGNRRL